MKLARICALTALLTGCGSVPLQEQTPAGLNLSGHWIATDDAGASPRRSSDFRSGFIAQDFPLLVAREMRIEQDQHSMGIEYSRGEYRDVSWGERRRGIWEVRAGWHEGALHIYSEAPDTSAVEVWQLSEDRQELTIDLQVDAGRRSEFQRTFVRATDL